MKEEEPDLVLEGIVSRAVNSYPSWENIEGIIEEIWEWHRVQSAQEELDMFMDLQDLSELETNE